MANISTITCPVKCAEVWGTFRGLTGNKGAWIVNVIDVRLRPSSGHSDSGGSAGAKPPQPELTRLMAPLASAGVSAASWTARSRGETGSVEDPDPEGGGQGLP